jgi:UPF0663 protein
MLLNKAENNKPKRAKEEEMKELLKRLKEKLKSVPKLVYGIVVALITFIIVMLAMIFTPLNNGDNGSSDSSYVKEINHSGNEKKKEKEDTTKKTTEKKDEEKKSDEKKDDKKISEDKKTSEEKTNTESVTNTENTSNVTNQPSENAANNNVAEQPSAQKEKKPVYQTVHYDATGHWETQVISEAWDDDQYEFKVVGIQSGHIYDSVVDFARNGDLYGDDNYASKQVKVGTIHHDAVTTQVWVEDSPAHDEQVLVGWE